MTPNHHQEACNRSSAEYTHTIYDIYALLIMSTSASASKHSITAHVPAVTWCRCPRFCIYSSRWIKHVVLSSCLRVIWYFLLTFNIPLSSASIPGHFWHLTPQTRLLANQSQFGLRRVLSQISHYNQRVIGFWWQMRDSERQLAD